MKLSEIVQKGDWLIYYPKKKSFLSNAITKATFGPVIHASMVKDSETVFETDGDMIKADFTPLANVEPRHVLVIRVKGLDGQGEKIDALMAKYKGLPYGYWDIAMHGLFFWLNPPIRKKLVEFLTAKPFMVCSELVARITYEITGRKELEDYEGLAPEDLREIVLLHPEEYTIIEDHLPPQQ